MVGGNLYVGKARGSHLTGGAGYCLSRNLVERAASNFSALPRAMPDDVAVGHVVKQQLGVKLVEDGLFHSHLEKRLRQNLSPAKIGEQVSFGYNIKNPDDVIERRSFPNVPMVFGKEKDPLRFRSLWCFLESKRGGMSVGEGLYRTRCGQNRTESIQHYIS